MRVRALGAATALIVAVSIPLVAQAQAVRRGPPPPDRVVLEAATDVEMLLLGGRPMVQGAVNGGDLRPILIDTGAGGTAVDDSLVEELGLTVLGQVRVGSPSGAAPVDGRLVRIDSLTFGGVVVEGITAIAVDLQSVFRGDEAPPIILSPSSMVGMLVTFDFPAGRILVDEGSLPAEGSLGYGSPSPAPQVSLALGDHGIDAAVDTGSGHGVTVPASWMSDLDFASAPVEIEPGRMVGAEFTMHEATPVSTVHIGSEQYDALPVRFGEGLQSATIGVLILADYVLTIDATNRRHTLQRTRDER